MTDRTVPTEPTPEMIEAGSRAVCKSNGTDPDHSFDGIRAWMLENCVSIPVWEAMLAASPAAPGAEVAEAIHAARGFDPRDKSISGAGVPYGEWAATLKIAAAVSPFITRPGAEVEPVAWDCRITEGDSTIAELRYENIDDEDREAGWASSPLYPAPALSPPTTDAIRAQARREALEEAAAYHDEEAGCYHQLYLGNIRARNEEKAVRCQERVQWHRAQAGAIRALAGKPGEAE